MPRIMYILAMTLKTLCLQSTRNTLPLIHWMCSLRTRRTTKRIVNTLLRCVIWDESRHRINPRRRRIKRGEIQEITIGPLFVMHSVRMKIAVTVCHIIRWMTLRIIPIPPAITVIVNNITCTINMDSIIVVVTITNADDRISVSIANINRLEMPPLSGRNLLNHRIAICNDTNRMVGGHRWTDRVMITVTAINVRYCC